MNRIITIFSLFFLLVFCAMVMIVVYDLSISNLHLRAMPYKETIFTLFALCVLLLALIRIRRRWQGMRDMRRYKNFTFSTEIAKNHLLQSVIITSLEMLFFTATLLFCFSFQSSHPEYVFPMITSIIIILVESLIFVIRLLRGGISFRIGFNDELLAYFDREMYLYYYTGLQKVELHQRDLITFAYRDGLSLSFPTHAIPEKKQKEFRDQLILVLEKQGVFVDDSFRFWK